MRGIKVGAIVGGVSQLLVALLFVYYVLNWGGPFFRQTDGMSLASVLASPLSWLFSLVFAGLGAIAGAVGGTTRQILRGAAFSGVMSGLFCITILVIPVNVMLALSGGGLTDYSADKQSLATGLLAFVIVGAIAGAIGAIAKSSSTPTH
ncbi:hypothetical protein ACQ4M4_28480 [Leptolyngbya sp. AN02str]|uniref:hypothetical protein n=1 Tax=Leptolyngbya sp. AN02str TaxID=3423363 RepID=UPI003D31E0F6